MNQTLTRVVLITAGIAVVSLTITAVLFFTTNMGPAWELKGGTAVEEESSFTPEGITTIDVRTGSTDVVVGRSGGPGIKMRLHGTVYSGRSETIPTLEVEQIGEALQVATRRKDGGTFVLGFYSGHLILEIGLPDHYRDELLVRSGSGDVRIEDQQLSELSVETGSGDIQLRSIQAAVATIESSSGDQTVEKLRAVRSALTSSSGKLKVIDLEGGAAAQSSSGDITISYREFSSDLEVRSSSGDVELNLTETARFDLEARATSGDIDCAFPLTRSGADSEIRRNRLIGTVGKGGQRVVVQTSSGDISIAP